MSNNPVHMLIKATEDLARRTRDLEFTDPVTHVYNPLEYAGKSYREYLRKYASERKEIVFLGMNPGPWGMVQTGVPFGEIPSVRDWLGIEERVGTPPVENPKRPITGYACERSEVSGRRLWGLFRKRFITPDRFFKDHFVANYCPLVFMEESGRNRTPNKLPREEREPLFSVCDHYLIKTMEILRPRLLIGVGRFATDRATAAIRGLPLDEQPEVYQILHPSPASPVANRGWAEQVETKLIEIGVWPKV